jgi:hypothetical protein
MRELLDELAGTLKLAKPSAPTEVFAALCAQLSERRGRPVMYRLVELGTASGLYLDMAYRDIVCIEAHTSPWHQLVILGHEFWHMVAGHCGNREAGAAVAARFLTDDPDLNAALQVAARTDFRQVDEAAAEFLGLNLTAHLRGWVDRADSSPVPRRELAQRIQASLGHRQG